jgi:hypothetical protein
VAGLVAFRSAKPVEATAGSGPDGNMVLGSHFGNSPNTAADVTLIAPSTTLATPLVLDVEAAFGASAVPNINAIYAHGKGSGVGLLAVGGGGIGTDSTRLGLNAALAAVYYGTAANSKALLAEVPSSSSTNAISVYGLNNSQYAGPSPGAGGFAVYGLSAKGHGLVGATAAAGGAAVVGATNGVAGAFAGAFYGPLIVGGDLTVVGGAKSAAVPHPDGSHRRLYCLESPESWFEDFGKGTLDCGRADVPMDPDFAALVDLDDYHVFLTPYGACDVLAVTEQTPRGFRVEAADPARATRFSWRVVAKRKDIAGPRLAEVVIPPEPTLPPIPEPGAVADVPPAVDPGSGARG